MIVEYAAAQGMLILRLNAPGCLPRAGAPSMPSR
jgi:hypothetical protein